MFNKVLKRLFDAMDPTHHSHHGFSRGQMLVNKKDLEDLYNQFVYIDNAYRMSQGQPPSGLQYTPNYTGPVSAPYGASGGQQFQAQVMPTFPTAQGRTAAPPIPVAPSAPAANPWPPAPPAPFAPYQTVCCCSVPKPIRSSANICGECGYSIGVVPASGPAPIPVSKVPTRVSVDPNDPGYTKDASKYIVFLNGVEMQYVDTADSVSGYVRLYNEVNGAADLNDPRDYFGTVRIEDQYAQI